MALVAVNVIFGSIMLAAVAIRLHGRLFVRFQIGLDDLLIFIALVFSAGLAVTVVLGNMRYGWDRHVWDLGLLDGLSGARNTLIVAFVAKLLFTLASTSTRLSLILFYYRLIQDSESAWMVRCWDCEWTDLNGPFRLDCVVSLGAARQCRIYSCDLHYFRAFAHLVVHVGLSGSPCSSSADFHIQTGLGQLEC